MRVSEIFQSVQGEGFLTGTPSVFVRTTGCNLRCWFCDTPYTSWHAVGEPMAVKAVVERVLEFEVSHVVLTGGEPLLQPSCVELCEQLRQRQRHVTIETAGTCHLPVQCDLLSLSPKLSNSVPTAEPHNAWAQRHQRNRHQPETVARLLDQALQYQVKFVVDRREDIEEVEDYLRQMPMIQRDRVLLMPQGTDVERLRAIERWLEPLCHEIGLRFCPRKQIEWFGLARAT